MAICIRCRRDPCRCAPTGELGSVEEGSLDLAEMARLARIRNEAAALSAAYLCWFESGRSGPEPLVPADVRRRIRELMDEAAHLEE